MERGLIFHHDNAPVHMARLVTDLLNNWDWELFGQPRYSPDLAPADFYLFPKTRDFMRETFWSTDEINEATSASLHLTEAGFGHVFDSWVSRWQKNVLTMMVRTLNKFMLV